MARARDLQEESIQSCDSTEESRDRAWLIARDGANRCRQLAKELEARGRALDSLATLMESAYERHGLDNSTEEALWNILIGVRGDILRLR